VVFRFRKELLVSLTSLEVTALSKELLSSTHPRERCRLTSDSPGEGHAVDQGKDKNENDHQCEREPGKTRFRREAGTAWKKFRDERMTAPVQPESLAVWCFPAEDVSLPPLGKPKAAKLDLSAFQAEANIRAVRVGLNSPQGGQGKRKSPPIHLSPHLIPLH